MCYTNRLQVLFKYKFRKHKTVWFILILPSLFFIQRFITTYTDTNTHTQTFISYIRTVFAHPNTKRLSKAAFMWRECVLYRICCECFSFYSCCVLFVFPFSECNFENTHQTRLCIGSLSRLLLPTFILLPFSFFFHRISHFVHTNAQTVHRFCCSCCAKY